MHLATGVDLIEIERVQDAIARHGDRFLQRIFTPAELIACGGRPESLAARFAAKEAAAKALGRGIGDVAWQEIEVIGNSNHAPQLNLHGEAARLASEQGLMIWSVSLSHTREYALAFVVALHGPPEQ
jgi:holo-[acyl-carrier protein] synthase